MSHSSSSSSAASSSSSSTSTSPYIYQDRVVLIVSDDDKNNKSTSNNKKMLKSFRFESWMEWQNDNLIHPFGKLVGLLAPLQEVIKSGKVHENIQVTVQLSSRPTQSYPYTELGWNEIPILGDNDGEYDSGDRLVPPSVLYGPSGFRMQVKLSSANITYPTTSTNQVLEQIQNRLVPLWAQKGILTTPLRGAKWDLVHQKNKNKIGSNSNNVVFYLHVPALVGGSAAWSADALYQTLDGLLLINPNGCNNDKNNYENLAQDWSSLLVNGTATQKQMWWKVSSTSTANKVQFGMQIELANTKALGSSTGSSSLLTLKDNDAATQMAESIYPSCPLVTRTVLVHDEKSSHRWSNNNVNDEFVAPLLPSATLEQVIRRPWPNQGRLETWIKIAENTNNDSANTDNDPSLPSSYWQQDCVWEFRQVLPHFMTPVWQSLTIAINGNIIENDESASLPKAHVEWDPEDMSSVWTVTSFSPSLSFTTKNVVEETRTLQELERQQKEEHILFSLDYQPAFLSLDDFPGDPNRGRDLPPAQFKMICTDKSLSSSSSLESPIYSFTIYSNPLLLLPPVPDMSMPFNVLSLTCSLYAYIIGSIMTLLIRKSSERVTYQLHPEKKPPSKLQSLKNKIRSKFLSRKKKGNDGEQDTTYNDASSETTKTTGTNNPACDENIEESVNVVQETKETHKESSS